MIKYLIRSIPNSLKVTLVVNFQVDSSFILDSFGERLSVYFFDCDGKYPMYQRALAQKHIIDSLTESSFPVLFMDSDMIFTDFDKFWFNFSSELSQQATRPCIVLTERKHPFPASRINGGFIGLLSKKPAQKLFSRIVEFYSFFSTDMKVWWGDQIILNVIDVHLVSAASVLTLPSSKFNYSPAFVLSRKLPLISLVLFCAQCFYRQPYLLHLKGDRKILYGKLLFDKFLRLTYQLMSL